MAEHPGDHKHRQAGFIDFDAYRAEAIRERKAVRDHVLWDIVLPALWGAPVRVAGAVGALLSHVRIRATVQRP
jgi:hypothetical protein